MMGKFGVLSLALVCAHLAYGDIHTLKYFYTASAEVPNFPEFVVVAMVDDVQFVHYDSNTKKAVPKQDWIKQNEDSQYWEREAGKFLGSSQSFKANIDIAKSRFNQTGGVHTYQYMCGCQWDDETQAIDGYDQESYDGEDLISLDIKNLRYIASKQQGEISVNRWNSDAGYLAYWKQYYSTECIEWLKKYVQYGSSTLGRKVVPEVSLVPKDSGVACHATGFYPEAVMIAWKKNGVEMEDDVNVGETLPNEDGTFQKRAVLTISPEERKNAKYSCEVTHKSGAPINEVLDEAKLIRSGNGDSGIGMGTGTIIGIIVAVLVVGGAIAGIVFMVLKKKDYEKASSQGDTNSDISNSNPIVRTAETEKLNADPSV